MAEECVTFDLKYVEVLAANDDGTFNTKDCVEDGPEAEENGVARSRFFSPWAPP